MAIKNKKPNWLDGLIKKNHRIAEFDLPLAQYVIHYKRASVLFSRSRRSNSFFTADSKLYFTPEEFRRRQRGERVVRLIGRLDSLQSRVFANSKIYAPETPANFLTAYLNQAYAKFRESAMALLQNSEQRLSVVRLWNLSIVGAVIFGMLTMIMIYRSLGQSVSAAIRDNDLAAQMQSASQSEGGKTSTKIASSDSRYPADTTPIDLHSFATLLQEQNNPQDLETEIRAMVKGYPIESMVPQIAKQDRVTAAFIIAIAKQESDWGVHVPVYQGQDCYNYWGWRGANAVGTGGHTCFASPAEAVDTVAKRIQFLTANQKLNTPAKMIVWKCGDCSWDNQQNMQTWINAVSLYFKKLNTN